MADKKAAKSKKHGSRLMSHQRPTLFIVLVTIIILIIAVSVSTLSLKQRESTYKAQQIEIEKQLEEETARSEEIDGLEEYMKSDEYVEDVARERLGLVYPDEIVFKTQ